MPKVKTHRGAAKRFRLTKGGKVKRAKMGSAHLLAKKSPKRKRHLRKSTLVDGAFEKRIKRMLGQ